MLFDFIGVRLNGPKAEGKRAVINWIFEDTGERYVLNLENCALTYVAGKNRDDADASLTLSRTTLNAIFARQTTFMQEIPAGKVKLSGNPMKLMEVFGLLDTFQPTFEIVEPKKNLPA
jgi:alkyl sulfatase BDS1-like metallo-beta-lactamase superfamily hydrolase